MIQAGLKSQAGSELSTLPREIQLDAASPLDRHAMESRNTKIDAGRNLERRKTRKGTRSCWQCKRRKVKCVYARPGDDVCIGCARRCVDCVGQEFPEQGPRPSSKPRLVGDRIGRLESMIQQLADQVGGHVASSKSLSTPGNNALPVFRTMMLSTHQTLSQTLLAVYPSASDLSIICRSGGILALYATQTFMSPSHLLEKRVAFEAERLWGPHQQREQYNAETHPVLIARQMLLLACVLQHLHSVGSARSSGRSDYRQLGELSQPPRALARRVAEPAMTLVAAHDRFTSDTIEGLECLWFETLYHERNGNPRQSWLATRRAISAAHLVGLGGRRHTPITLPKSILHRPDGAAADLRQIWLRLVYKELELCLASGLPPSASYPEDALTYVADSVSAKDDRIDTSKLERQHVAIASHLIERTQCDSDFEDLDATRRIHDELEDAKTSMPSEWWHIPSLPRDETGDDKHLFETTIKLRAQIIHSYLVLLANLPHFLQRICSETDIPITTIDAHYHHQNHDHHHEYYRNCRLVSSRSICIEASRDLLRRFIHLRTCERTAGYFRLLNHYAGPAAATLLLTGLLDGRQAIPTSKKSLGDRDHQRHLSDRALVSEAIERMRLEGEDEEEDGGDDDMYFHHSSGAGANSDMRDVLLRLLALKAGAGAVVLTYRKPGEAFSRIGNAVPVDEDQDELVLPFPFAGNISIAPQAARHRSAVSENRQRLSRTMNYFPVVLDEKEAPQSSVGDIDEDEEGDDDEANLTKAMELRRKVIWPASLYMCMMRPVR